MIFHEKSATIFEWMQQQPNVKEESITDWLLFELSKKCSYLKYYAFTRHEEMRNGADWECWVLTFNYAYRFRIQAKKLKSKNDNYPSIAYSNNIGLQIDLLLAAAKNDDAFPLYIFYSDEKQDTDQILKSYSLPCFLDMIQWCDTCDNGAYLSPAQAIYDNVLAKPKRKINASTLLNISFKLSCFDFVFEHYRINCINCEIEKQLNILNDYLQEKYKYGCKYKYNSNTVMHQIPHWLSHIIEDRQTHAELSDWFEKEFRGQLPNIAGVAVLDLRKVSQ